MLPASAFAEVLVGASQLGPKATARTDALVIGVGRTVGASTIVTSDARWRAADKRVQIPR